MENIKSAESKLETVEDAVSAFVGQNDIVKVMEFLKDHKDEVGEFCLQVVEAYREGDKTGVMQLARIIEQLL